jgi:hypothetical protein
MSGLRRALFLTTLGVIPLAIGVWVMLHTADVPADGPYRAMLAYNWFRNPHIAVCGSWLPGPMYLNGLFFWAIRDPLVSTRVFNLVAGSLAVPAFYLLWERIFAPPVAVLAAIMLAILPLRVGLAAGSMTEPGFLLELGAGTWLLVASTDGARPRYGYLTAALGLLSLACLSRYEAWLLIPFFPVFYYLKSRRWIESLAVAGVLAVGPTLWMLGNHYCFGDALQGFRAATTGERYAETVDPIAAVSLLGTTLVQQTGLLVTVCLMAGGILILATRVRPKVYRRLRPETLLYAALLVATWLVMIRFAMARGPSSFQSRYILQALVLALPLAAVPFASIMRRWPPTTALVAAVFAASLAIAGREVSIKWLPDLWLITRQPHDFIDEMTEVATWLEANGHGNSAMLSTPIAVKCGWATNYLPLLLPEASDRIRTMSYWLSDADVEAFMRDSRPTLLIVGSSEIDREEIARFQRLTHRALRPEDIVLSTGGSTAVTIYRIAGLH